jgi:hypothetical protein
MLRVRAPKEEWESGNFESVDPVGGQLERRTQHTLD